MLRARYRIALGRRIREARQRTGLTQEELAEATGVTKGYVFEIEGRGANLSFESLLAIARALGMGLRDLMPDTEHDRPTALALDDLAAAVGRLSERLDALERLRAETGDVRDEIRAFLAQARRALPGPATDGDGGA